MLIKLHGPGTALGAGRLRCWLSAGLSSDERWLVRVTAGSQLPSPAGPLSSLAGPMLTRVPGSCALAWPACFQACLGPTLLGRQHFTRKVFLPAPGLWELNTAGTSLPSLPLPFVGALQPFATSIPPLLVRGWGQHEPDSSSLPALVFPPPDGGTVCWLLTGGGSGVDWAAPSPLQLVALEWSFPSPS